MVTPDYPRYIFDHWVGTNGDVICTVNNLLRETKLKKNECQFNTAPSDASVKSAMRHIEDIGYTVKKIDNKRYNIIW